MEPGNKQLRGSSLVETLIAMVITTFCVILALSLFADAQKSNMYFMMIKAQAIAQTYMSESLATGNIREGIFEEDGLRIEKKTGASKYGDCICIKLAVSSRAGRLLFELEGVLRKNGSADYGTE